VHQLVLDLWFLSWFHKCLYAHGYALIIIYLIVHILIICVISIFYQWVKTWQMKLFHIFALFNQTSNGAALFCLSFFLGTGAGGAGSRGSQRSSATSETQEMLKLLCKWMHSFRGSSTYKLAESSFYRLLLWNSNWLSSITKKGRLKVHLG
jgi:hypothetical protein